MDRLITAIAQDQDASIFIEEVTKANFRVIKLPSSGGFLKSGNTALLMGVQGDQVKDLLKIIEKNCKTREVVTSPLTVTMPEGSYALYPVNVTVGGATVFILDVDQYVCYQEVKMKVIPVVVPDTLMDQLMDRCLKKKIQFIRVASPGGFSKQRNTTVILGTEEDRLGQLKETFENSSQDLDGDKEGIHVFYMAGDIGREF